MPTVFEKLQLKDAAEIVVLNPPSSFEPALAELTALARTAVRREVPAAPVHFALAFVTRQADLDAVSQALTMRAVGDAALWFAYPKKTSRTFRCEFDRDNGWQVMRDAGFDTVRIIAIDEDWSALRWRKTHYIRNMTRDPGRAELNPARRPDRSR